MRYFILFSFSLFLLATCRQKTRLMPKQLDYWYFAVGKPANGLRVSSNQIPVTDSLVQLPFRINLPNTPLWFITKVQFKKDQLLYVNADDGSQVFYAQKQVRQLLPYTYSLPTTKDSVTLAIRVLNNAMAGGLRKAELYPLQAGILHFEAQERGRQLGKPLSHQHLLDTAFTEKAIKEQQTFRFTAWGDSQGGWKTFRQLSEDMATQHPVFSIGLGDLVSDGSSPAQWQGFLEALAPLSTRTNIFPVIGNHDYDGYYDELIPDLYLRHIAPKYYFAWSYQKARFVALDPNETFPIGIKGAQRNWFLDEITGAEWDEAQWRFILLHQPPYSAGWPGYHGDDFIRELVNEYAESAGIDFVLSGHSHCFERLSKTYGNQQTHFLIFGGAGGGREPLENSTYPQMDTIIKAHHYGLFELEETQVRLHVIGLEKKVLDQHVFQKSTSQ